MNAYFSGEPELNLLNPETQRIFRDLVENIKMGIFMTDSRGNLFYVNHAFNEIFDFSNHTHATGKNWTQLLFPHNDLRTEFLAKLQSIGNVKDFGTTYVNNYGQKSSLLVSANHIYGQQGKIIGVRGLVIDITQRRQLEEELRIRQEKLEEILNFYNSLSDFMSTSELYGHIVHQTARILEARRCSIMSIDPSSQEISVKASFGISQEFLENTQVKIGAPVAGLLALRSQAVLVDNIEYHDLFKRQNRKSYTSRSFISAPLMHNQKLIGIINVSEKNGNFTPMDLKVLETIAKQAAINISKLQILNDFEHLSQTDPMTGLFNYRCFIQKLESEITRASRYCLQLSLMMVDVDNFKIYNDKHGHPGGDKLLRRLAQIFRENLRATEHICRYGGDEFGIILTNTDGEQAGKVAEKIGDIVRSEFAEEKITLSIGIAKLHAGHNKETFIRHADQALYQAKKFGRNRVIVSNEVFI